MRLKKRPVPNLYPALFTFGCVWLKVSEERGRGVKIKNFVCCGGNLGV